MSAPYRPPKTFGRPVRRHGQVLADHGGWGLSDLMSNTLEPAYAEVAARRPAGRPPGHRWQGTALLAAGLMIAGLLIAVAYRDTTRSLPDRTRAREALVERIDERRTTVSDLSEQSRELRIEVTALQQEALSSTAEGQELLDAVAVLELANGLREVTGSGVVLTLDNPAAPTGSDPVGGGGNVLEALITDRDLARAVNTLWAVGAEAVAINGHRIGPTTPIRQAGGAVLIDFQPVSAPYVIQAIGPVASMGADFATTSIGRRLATYRTAYNATFTIDNASSLTLPPGTEPTVTYATVQR